MKKFIMIAGVKHYIEEENAPVADPVKEPVKDPVAPADEDVTAQAEEIGKSIAKSIMANLNLDAIGERQKTKVDGKMAELLKGKDITDKNALTAEEKIVAFYHALVTKDHAVAKALSEGTPADGGYLFPDEFAAELIKHLQEPDTMRSIVRVVPMNKDIKKYPKLGSRPKIYWTAENASKTTTTADFSEITLTARKAAAIIYSSDELIEDSTDIDVVRMIIELFAEAIKAEENRVICAGNGTTEPTGLLTAISASTIKSIACQGNLDFDDINDLYYTLPKAYRTRAMWLVAGENVKELDKIKDSQGRYIWRESVQEGGMPTMKGKPVMEMDDIGAATIVFGDFKYGYWLGDRKSMTVKISNDTETAFTKDQTAIRVVIRIAGTIADEQALVALTNIP